VIEVILTGGGSGLADEILDCLSPLEADFRIRLVDSLESAGEARRFQGRTVLVELDSEAGFDTADLVLDLDGSYSGDADRFRPQLAMVSMVQRVFSAIAEDAIEVLHGVFREPVVAVSGGVDALAGQVTQLFNGRDPEQLPFGGTLAFNSRILDDAQLDEQLQEIPQLAQARICIERVQSDSFYTAVASLWVKTPNEQQLLSLANAPYAAGLGLSPDSGRVEADEPIRVMARLASPGWVHLLISADLERTLWAHDARDAVLARLEKV